MNTDPGTAPFRARTVVLIVTVAVMAFAGFLLLIAFAPPFRSGHDARGHALSTSGNGYAALVEMTDVLGSHALIVREENALATHALLVVTPEIESDPAQLAKLLAARDGHPTLIVLPKWTTRPMPENRQWSQRGGLIWPDGVVAALGKTAPKIGVEQTPFAHPRIASVHSTPRLARAIIGRLPEQQRLAGTGFVPLLLDRDGRVVIGQLIGRPVYLLADPDLLNNQGFADPWTARQGWQVIDDLSTTNEIGFDLTLNGFGTKATRNPLRLVFEPPFLPVTLIIVAAALLAGLHGAIRFGAPVAAGRAIAIGKRTLVDNAALLFRASRKEHRVGGAYAALTRDLVAQATHAPARLSGEALDQYLDRAGRDAGDPPYATLAWRADAAEDRDQLLDAARALYRWRRNRTR